MPLYEYQCDSCGARFERIQKFSDPLVETCPTCGGVVKKLLSSPAFHLKGSGWYATDYARKSEGSGSSAKGEGSSKEGASEAGSGGKDAPSKDSPKESSSEKTPATGPTTTPKT